MRLDYTILQSEEGRDELARRALEILKSKSEDKTSYEAIANALHLATEEVLPKRARAEPLWFSQSVLALRGLINLRNNAFDAYHTKPRSKPRRFALQSARGTLQYAIRKAKSEWIFKQLGRVNDGICGASGSKAAWTAIKTLKRGLGPSKRPPPARMKLPDGTFASSAEENAEVFAKHFEKLYNSDES